MQAVAHIDGHLSRDESGPETSLYYYRARYYDPNVGRFLGEDPLGFEGGADAFAYVENSPTGLIDPAGLAPGPGLLDRLLDRIIPILPMPPLRKPTPCPIAPANPCSTRGGRPYDPRPKHHHARDFSTPDGLGTAIPAPLDGSVGFVNANGWPVGPPYDLNQQAPSGATNSISINTVTGYNITYFHVTPLVPSGSDVGAGQPIGLSDDTGRQLPGPGRHIHVQITDPWGRPVDPLKYFPNCN